jgi:peroxiredoxin
MGWTFRQVDLDRALQNHAAPGFRLRSQRGQLVTLASYRSQANLVLLFANGLDEPPLRQALQAFAGRQTAYEAENARVLAIVQAPETRMPSTDQPATGTLTLLLVDPDGATHQSYAELLPEQPEPGEAMVFVLDRFGAPHVAFLSHEPGDPALHQQILSWLRGIELECPECGVSEWP